MLSLAIESGRLLTSKNDDGGCSCVSHPPAESRENPPIVYIDHFDVMEFVSLTFRMASRIIPLSRASVQNLYYLLLVAGPGLVHHADVWLRRSQRFQ